MQGSIMATARSSIGRFSDAHLSMLPVITSPNRLRHAIARANASLLEDIEAMPDLASQPTTFSSGEAAIAVGWTYIDDLENCVSSVNHAVHTLNSKSVELARSHFGDGIATRVQLINETAFDAARYMLEYRISSISRAFEILGKLVEIGASGELCMGQFTLTYGNEDFRAMVSSDQQASVVENGTTRPVSVREVTTDLAEGKLVP